ncbi:Hypothetical predicted protein [Cloeon dipterum]|uniref:C2H2-type domain-containing protein n=1 Tax=Cloeon dipterum TaxID=197152 RepID=A0A8S1CGF6_9INSE|nr:Hypothetical predicted protein [Cloeon dipterum]
MVAGKRQRDYNFSSGGMDYACQFCARMFRTKSNCWSHEQMHLGNTTCHLCNKVFSFMQALHRHNATVHAPQQSPKKF